MGVSANQLKAVYEQDLLPDIRAALRQLFVSADSAILALAEKATGNSEQNRHFESAQSLRITHHDISRRFADHLLVPFTAAQASAANDNEHINSLRKLLAVDVDADSQKHAAALQDLQQRLDALGGDGFNPLAPAHFVDGFLQGLGQAQLDIHSKMLVLRLFESELYRKIDAYIARANRLLAEHGVLPQLKSESRAAPAAVAAPQFVDEQGELLRALADLQANDYEQLEHKLAPASLVQWRASEAVRDLCLELEQQQLLKGGQQSITSDELEKIRQIQQLFALVLVDRNLPDIARALLAQLQLPYTRVALTDPGFFADEQNIAKSLLHEIIRLSASWQPDLQALAEDAFFRRQVDTITVLWEAERIASVPFRDMLFDYLMVEEAQRQSDALASQRLMDSQHSAVQSEEVRQQVDSALQQRLAALQLPAAARELLDEGWSHVLYLYALNDGMQSESWHKALALVDELLFTLQDPQQFHSRTELLVRLPALLKSIREGLSAIELSPALINQLLSALETEHKQQVAAIADTHIDEIALHNARIAAREAAPAFARPVARRQPQPESQAASAPVAPDVAESPPVDEPPAVAEPVNPAAEKLAGLTQGSWLLWNREEGQQRCRLAAFIKHTGKYILTDRSGAKIGEFLHEQMLDMITDGRIELIESELIFERALESVIGGIREKR